MEVGSTLITYCQYGSRTCFKKEKSSYCKSGNIGLTGFSHKVMVHIIVGTEYLTQ